MNIDVTNNVGNVPVGVYARIYWKGWNTYLKDQYAVNPYENGTADANDWLTGFIASSDYQRALQAQQAEAKRVKTAKQARHRQNKLARADVNRRRSSGK